LAEDEGGRISRRDFLKAVAITAAVAAAAPVVRLAASVEAEGGELGWGYIEFFDITEDKDRLEYYGAMGLVIDINGRKCVANPLIPDRCISYTRPAWEDRFPVKPPGATDDFYSRCIRCGLCYFACNLAGYNAIRLGGPGDGFRLLGTPIVDRAWSNPCTLCMECTKVCPTGALAEIPKEKARMGIALIDPDLCWAWNSGDCKSCAKACPFGAEVFEFTFNEWGVHTRVRPDKCRGCGLCVQACPITGAAIHVLPPEEYERRTRNYKNTGMSYEEYLELILRTEKEDPAKATLRAGINTDYIQNVRGIQEEKIVTQLQQGTSKPSTGGGKGGGASA
jgi:ferredoxin